MPIPCRIAQNGAGETSTSCVRGTRYSWPIPAAQFPRPPETESGMFPAASLDVSRMPAKDNSLMNAITATLEVHVNWETNLLLSRVAFDRRTSVLSFVGHL